MIRFFIPIQMRCKNLIVYNLIVVFLFSSCASTTLIDSSPSNAKIYINGENVGTTPYKHRDTKIVGSTNQVRIEKQGFQTYNTTFSKNEEIAVGPLIGGLFVLVPYLWIMKYKKARVYDLRPVSKRK
ncbi:PEGA domain-containing protein [Gramella sp. Hel_I_59]|uniref:PEGA domain-containing protein n=1 Tax=unclassified Christiangramia TaxID=2615027 RepID=UPI00114FB85E|nr:PEGA domain-containing protein [Gramella sp. Hel_I_59]TQI70010.1 PEGA domain-containing protein [Gramella sp. Hel_I_59]